MDFIRDESGQVIGVTTDRAQGDIYAPVVIVCEGVNNLLTQKLGLIDHDLEPARMALAFKQVIGLPQDTINSRFGLADANHGLAVSVLGDVSLGLPGMGFVYTNKTSVSVGLGLMLDAAVEYRLRPYDVLQRYLNHPAIAPLIEGGQLMEYGAHLIPEGGYRDVPKLFTGGAMVAGDAASMVNALHWEGTNMAIIAGKLAAETAVEAHAKSDFSAESLSTVRSTSKGWLYPQGLEAVSQLLPVPGDASDVYGYVSELRQRCAGDVLQRLWQAEEDVVQEYPGKPDQSPPVYEGGR